MIRLVRVALACVVSGVFVLGVAALPAGAQAAGVAPAAVPAGGPNQQRNVGFPKEGMTPPAVPKPEVSPVVGTCRTHSHWTFVVASR